MTEGMGSYIISLMFLLLQIAGVTFAVMADSYINRKQRKVLLLAILLILSLIAQNFIETYADMNGHMVFVRTVTSIYGYAARPVVVLLFAYLVDDSSDYRLCGALLGVNAVIYLTALFSKISFWISEDNRFHRGPLAYSCHIVSGIMLVYLVYLTIRKYAYFHKKDMMIPIFNVCMIILATVLDGYVAYSLYRVTFLLSAMVSGSIFYYIWLHLQFVREHENSLMAEQRIQIMMTQIQPHFLYNTLTTIQALCLSNPKKASDITGRFGIYLRQNLDSLRSPELIPVKKELEHTRVYVEIEEIRFPYIHVEYDTADTEFQVPALTIQPIVENAIRHGVRIREEGRVLVSTRRLAGWHEIVIRDNGQGFDPKTAERADESHIGIANVRERIEKMCGGTLTVNSIVGEGTTVTIRIPDRE